jgi:hypothetical protein
MSKYKSFISVQSVVAAFETQKKLARTTRRARRFLDGMSLPNPKDDNKGQAICILNPDGIPSHSPGLAEGLPLGNGFSNVATRRHCCFPDYRGLKPTATINCRDATIWRKLFRAELSSYFMPNWPSSDLSACHLISPRDIAILSVINTFFAR